MHNAVVSSVQLQWKKIIQMQGLVASRYQTLRGWVGSELRESTRSLRARFSEILLLKQSCYSLKVAHTEIKILHIFRLFYGLRRFVKKQFYISSLCQWTDF